ncbi:conserved hypothetical protein [Verticillium alfalfae VaMs.102]|uniref:FAD-binding PCMH-type domain-containing protein n=1 Tax=Verticillium alfalfae (strain VaMs.102 / ATCC MYA-4576 / FGSC 10136) TaxID=526221 RepID=C9SP32_VERA1|nr:conserved hypothetical protein [Verticillium alfalfae VaMs.102]EEY20547.1 conserved hypothetical protein [Verticillium alfalfae VaMs.102]
MKISAAAIISALALEGASAASVNGPRCHCYQCTALSKTEGLEGKVWSPDEQRYDERLTQYYSANAAQAPWCMVFPESAEDVSKIVKVFNQHQCPFGMRSGAHSAFKGANGIKDGVTVDFGNLSSTTYDKATEIASVGPGSDWGKVYKTLATENVVGVGGRADVVGVGGFTTGGGYSFHTGVRGFACDNVENFEVVVGDGSIVNANAKENTDLWKALKGGSGNFGFVTRLDIKVWPSAQIYASLNGYAQEHRFEAMKAYYNFVLVQDLEPESQVIYAQTYDKTGYGVGGILSNINANISSAFDEFLAIEALYTIPVTGPAHEVVPVFTGPTPLGLFANWQTGMVAHDENMMKTMDEIFHAHIDKMKAAAPDADFEMIFQWQPVTQGIVNVMEKRGGNSLGLEHVVKDGPVIMYNIVFTVDTAANQEIVLPIALEMNKAIQAAADGLGLNKHWQFLNYAHSSQDPISHYGAENIAHMKAVSSKYDPNQVFQKLRQTGFHLPA